MLRKDRRDDPVSRWLGTFLVCTVVASSFVAAVLLCVGIVALLFRFASWAVGA